MIIRNAVIHDAVHKKAYKGDILVRDGKLVSIGGKADPEAGQEEEILDASGLHAYPGFVDAHSHIGLDGYGGPTGTTYDYNEMNDICCPQLRGMDSYYAQDAAIPMALTGGVTSVAAGPGSANVLGGTFLAVKLYGNTVEEAMIRPEVAMKCAFGENPKRCYKDKVDSARMTTAAKLREMLFTARDYMLRKEAAGDDITKQPKFDMKMEALIPVLKREIPLKAHAHRSDDIMTAIRIAKEFDVKITIEHCTEGHLIVDELKAAGVPVAVGPTLTNASKLELLNKSWSTPGILSAAGLQVSIITDAPVIPQQYLPLCAGLAVKAGMDPFKALQAITINPARHIGIEDRVGSLEAGKDADIVLTDGDPLVSDTAVRYVIVDGKIRVKNTAE
ncbi:MAG: amidohydrolase [Lachnospiraceae bacterium]|nr:amidohydrolase [Lachnospiraceae bacterium]